MIKKNFFFLSSGSSLLLKGFLFFFFFFTQGLSLAVVHGFLIVVASLVAENRS